MTGNGVIELPARGALVGPSVSAPGSCLVLGGGALRIDTARLSADAAQPGAETPPFGGTRLEEGRLMVQNADRWHLADDRLSPDIADQALRGWADAVNACVEAPTLIHKSSPVPKRDTGRRAPPGHPAPPPGRTRIQRRKWRRDRATWLAEGATGRTLLAAPPDETLNLLAACLGGLITPDPLTLTVGQSPVGTLEISIAGIGTGKGTGVAAIPDLANLRLNLLRHPDRSEIDWQRARVVSLLLRVAEAAFQAAPHAEVRVDAREDGRLLGRLALDRIGREITLALLARAWPDSPRLYGHALILAC